jgi:hypothetical protein
LHGVLDLALVTGPEAAPPSTTRQPPRGHDLFHGCGKVSRQRRPLGDVPEPPSVLEAVRRGAEQPHLSGRGREEAQQDPEEGRLA